MMRRNKTMIIVSQDKKTILNFDNIKSVDIVENEVYITDDILMDEGAKIGEYVTEERANEVLQEISERLENWENLKAGQPTGVCSYRYIMPKE